MHTDVILQRKWTFDKGCDKSICSLTSSLLKFTKHSHIIGCFYWLFFHQICSRIPAKLAVFSKNLSLKNSIVKFNFFCDPSKALVHWQLRRSVYIWFPQKQCIEHLFCFNHFFALIKITYFKRNGTPYHILFYLLFISNMLIIFLITSHTYSKPVVSLFYPPFHSNFPQPIINILSTLLTRLLLLGSTYFSVANLPRPSS